MTQTNHLFSARTGLAPPPVSLQTKHLDEESVIRLKEAMVPIFSQMGGDAKTLVDGFFTPRPELEYGNHFNRSSFIVTLLRGGVHVYVEFDGEPSSWDTHSADIDWRAVIQQAIEDLIGGEHWAVAFDLCEFLLAKHRDLIQKQQRAWKKIRAAGNCERDGEAAPKVIFADGHVAGN